MGIGLLILPLGRVHFSFRTDSSSCVWIRSGNRKSVCLGSIVGMSSLVSSSKEFKHKAISEAALGALQECLEILNSDDWRNKSGEWKVQQTRKNGETCYGRSGVQRKNKTFIAVGVIKAPAELVLKELWENVDEIPEWNKDVKENRVLLKVSEEIDVTYTVFGELVAGVIKARDFVDARCRQKVDESYCLSGCSIELPEMPEQKGKVRGENGAGILRLTDIPGESKCSYELIQNTDLKGMIPRSIVEKAIAGTMLQYMRMLRKHVTKSRSN